jgi:glycosyltransferase involved in cell wall biosynthesis
MGVITPPTGDPAGASHLAMRTAKRTRVVYWHNMPTPYQVDRWNAVARRGNLDLEVWFCSKGGTDRSWKIEESAFDFAYRYLPTPFLKLPGLAPHYYGLPPDLVTGRRRPDLLVSLYADPAFLAGWLVARTAGIRTAFRVLPTFDAWIRRAAPKERLKRFVFPRVDGFKVPGPEGAATAIRYGADPARIHVVSQSVDVARLDDARREWSPRREAVRSELGIQGCAFLFVGRLWRGKGVDHLLDAYARLRDLPTATTLLLAGDGMDEERYRAYARERQLPNVRFLGFVQQDALPRILAASDVLVFPTLGDPYGLVVEEAMASGLPVITTEAAGDIHLRLPDGTAGFVVPPANTDALEQRMRTLALDPALRRAMAREALRLVASRNHDHYAADFESFVEAVLRSPRAPAPVR